MCIHTYIIRNIFKRVTNSRSIIPWHYLTNCLVPHTTIMLFNGSHQSQNKKKYFLKKQNPEHVMGIPITCLEKNFFNLYKKKF